MHDKLRSGNYDWIVKYRSWHLKGNSLFISCLTEQGWEAQVIIRAVSKNIWNCTFVAPDSEFLKLTDFINEEFSEPLQISFEEIATGLLLKCDNLKLMINRDPWKMSFYNESDEVILTETYSSNEFNDPAKIQLGYYLEENKCVYTTQSFCLRQDEYLFGLGEHPVSQIRAGSKLVLWNRDMYSSDSIHSNKNVPFFFSTKGYGMFINSAAEIDLGFGTGMATSYNILNKNNVLDIFIIEGTTPAGIINSYTALTGKAGAPPAWTYGMCISAGEEYLSQRAIDEMLDRFEEFKISGDVLLICPSSLNSRKYSRFMRDANLKQLFSNIHSRGLKICLRIHPYVPIENELYHEAKIRNYLVKKSNGDVYIIDFTNSDNALEGAESTFRCRDLRNSNAAFIDFTNPDACSWYKDLYKYFFEAGADILSTEYGDDIPDDAVFFSGETGTTIHNLYSLLFNRIVFEITKQYKSYGTVFSRSGTAGIQKYSVSWSLNNGIDFEHLACTLKRGISAGLSGIPFWGICVDRVTEKLTKELLIRWIQFSVLCSHFRIPADILSGPHSHDEQTLAILKEQVLLRYSLYPYIFNLAHEGCISGLPVIRSMYLSFPDDPNTLNKDLQYMFGASLLVAPVYSENALVNVYLPEGEWIDYFNNEKYSGPRNITVIAALEHIPIFVKSGSIIPMMKSYVHIPEVFINPLKLNIYPDYQRSVYKLYEKEGISEFSCIKEADQIIIEMHSYRARSFSLQINGIENVKSILLISDTTQIEIKEYELMNRILEFEMPELLTGQIFINKIKGT